MKKTGLYILALLILGSAMFSCQKTEKQSVVPQQKTEYENILRQKTNPVSAPEGSPISKQDLDSWVQKTLEKNSAFEWTMADLKTIWSALQEKEGTLAIGYKPSSMKEGETLTEFKF